MLVVGAGTIRSVTKVWVWVWAGPAHGRAAASPSFRHARTPAQPSTLRAVQVWAPRHDTRDGVRRRGGPGQQVWVCVGKSGAVLTSGLNITQREANTTSLQLPRGASSRAGRLLLLLLLPAPASSHHSRSQHSLHPTTARPLHHSLQPAHSALTTAQDWWRVVPRRLPTWPKLSGGEGKNSRLGSRQQQRAPSHSRSPREGGG